VIARLLDRPLRLERPEPTPDGRGGWIEAWALLREGRGRLVPLSGRDLQAAGRAEARVSHALYLPPGSGARPGDRVVLGARLFRVAVTGLGRPGAYEKLLLEERREGE